MAALAEQQSALLLPVKHAAFEVIHNAQVPKPAAGQILVKNYAVALNPLDWKIQKYDFYVSYPAILGYDAAGEVVALGEGVLNLNIGDRVLFQGFYNNEQATFKQYTIAIANVTAKIPSNISYDEAASVSLALIAAAFGFYIPKPLGLGLVPAWQTADRNTHPNQPFFITGGSSSVGQFVIQLAKLSGFSPIIVTASRAHTDYLNSLGATHVIDLHAPISQLGSSIKEITSLSIKYAYNAISTADTQQAMYNILAEGGQMVLVHDSKIKTLEGETSKQVCTLNGWVLNDIHKDKPYSLDLFANITRLLSSGEIKPNRVRVLPDGLQGIIGGLKELEAGSISGVKLVAHPHN